MANIAGYTDHYFVKAKKSDTEKTKKMWFYCLSLGKDANGKRILIKKRGFETEKKAQIELRKAQVAADTGTYIKPTKSTYAEYITEWFETRKSTLSRMTVMNVDININRHIIPHIGYIPIVDLNVLHIEKFLRDLRAKGLAEGTLKKIFSSVLP